MKKIIRGGTIVTAVDTVQADVLIDGETIAGGRQLRRRRRRAHRRDRLLRAAGR